MILKSASTLWILPTSVTFLLFGATHKLVCRSVGTLNSLSNSSTSIPNCTLNAFKSGAFMDRSSFVMKLADRPLLPVASGVLPIVDLLEVVLPGWLTSWKLLFLALVGSGVKTSTVSSFSCLPPTSTATTAGGGSSNVLGCLLIRIACDERSESH